MRTRKKKKTRPPLRHEHGAARLYSNGRLWLIEERPKPQQLPTLPAGHAWHVVRSEMRGERVAAQALAQQGFAVFLPQFVRHARRMRQLRTSERVMIPGYVFVGFDGSAGAFHAITVSPGVEGLICSATHQPLAIPHAAMERFARAVGATEHAPVRRAFAPGERVRIAGGAFQAMIGAFDSVDRRELAKVLIEIMGRASAVTVPLTALERA